LGITEISATLPAISRTISASGVFAGKCLIHGASNETHGRKKNYGKKNVFNHLFVLVPVSTPLDMQHALSGVEAGRPIFKNE
jgi:hypothetical protein